MKLLKKFVVMDLGFLYESEGYSWMQRHMLNWKTRIGVHAAQEIVVPNKKLADQVYKYYRVKNITIDETIS